jgi:hypothetical protein
MISGSAIDREKGIIGGVSVITIGEAKGHGIGIDHRTLETVLQCAKEFSTGIKVKFRHGKAGEYQSVVDEVSGTLKNFSIDGNKVRADFHLFKSLPAEVKEKIFEMAETIPDQFGFSIVFSGGSEELENKKFARCEDLLSVDLTDKPAANPDGLFESKPMKNVKYENGKDGKHSKDCECSECAKSMSSAELLEAFQTLSKTVTDLAGKINAAPTVAQLSYKDNEGKEVFLSAEQIATVLADVGNMKKQVADGEKANIIRQLSNESRVIFKDDGTAYKFEELEKLDIGILKFAAKNSQILPTVARAVFTGTGNGPDENKFTKIGKDGKVIQLEGTELMNKSYEGLTLEKAIRAGTTAGIK